MSWGLPPERRNRRKRVRRHATRQMNRKVRRWRRFLPGHIHAVLTSLTSRISRGGPRDGSPLFSYPLFAWLNSDGPAISGVDSFAKPSDGKDS